jgi:hypothetical protein
MPFWNCCRELPGGVTACRGGEAIEGPFEVEHTTTVYSGLLRFNDMDLQTQKFRAFRSFQMTADVASSHGGSSVPLSGRVASPNLLVFSNTPMFLTGIRALRGKVRPNRLRSDLDYETQVAGRRPRRYPQRPPALGSSARPHGNLGQAIASRRLEAGNLHTMQQIVEQVYFVGTKERIGRLGLTPLVDEIHNIIAILAHLRDHKEAVRKIMARLASLSPSERATALEQLFILAGLRRLEETVEQEARKMPIYRGVRKAVRRVNWRSCGG